MNIRLTLVLNFLYHLSDPNFEVSKNKDLNMIQLTVMLVQNSLFQGQHLLFSFCKCFFLKTGLEQRR